jgi:hypothetical protein
MTKVQIAGTNIIGTVYDFNENYIWVANDEDIFVTKKEKVVEIAEAPEAAPVREYENELERVLTENKIDFDGYSDGENISYMIEGFTYTIDAYVDNVSGLYSFETFHKGQDEDGETKWSNRVEYKKLSTLIKNILKWADK